MSHTEWATYYERKTHPAIYPEGFVVRVLMSTFPQPLLDDRNYAGKRILDHLALEIAVEGVGKENDVLFFTSLLVGEVTRRRRAGGG